MNKCPEPAMRKTKRGVCVKPIKLKPGLLGFFGYKDVLTKSELSRHRALMRVLRAGEPPLGLYRRLNILMVLFKYKNPKLSKIFKSDRDWIGDMFGYGK
jgi:hypothetical protein